MTIAIRIEHNFTDFHLRLDEVLESHGVTALFGASGAGKTTVINALAGLLQPDSGRIELQGNVVFDHAAGIHVPPHRRRVGYVFQDARLFTHLSVRNNLLYGWRRSSAQMDKPAMDHVVDLLGIGHLLERLPAMLSGGEKQRVALGRALFASPDVLLLDEPLTGIDQSRKDEILPYLERLRDERRLPMIYVSHSVDEVARLADRMLVMDRGAIIARGTVSELMARVDLVPVIDRHGAGAVVHGEIRTQHVASGLSEVAFDGGVLLVPVIDAAPGTGVRLRIRARAITIALDHPGRISANNVLPVTIGDMRTDDGPYADVALHCGATTLVARITRHSIIRLGLRQELPAWAIIKAITLEGRGVAQAGSGAVQAQAETSAPDTL